MEFEVLGRTLRAHDLPEDLCVRLRAEWEFPEHTVAPVPYTVEVRGQAVDPAAWAKAGQREVMACNERFSIRTMPEGWWYTDETGEVAGWHGPELTSVQVNLSALHPPSAPLRAALYMMINEALWCSGLMPLHAAAACVDGQGVVFLGPSGRGKSTTLLRAMQAHWTPVAEDLLWYDPATRLIYGWERYVRLLPASVALLPPDMAHGSWRKSSDGKVNIPYGALPGAQIQRGGTPLACLVLLEREPGSPSAVVTATPREVALALWEATGLPLSQRARQFAGQQIASIQGQVQGMKLLLGSTPLPFHALMPVG